MAQLFSLGGITRMKTLHKFISPIFSVGLVIFVPSYLIVHFTDGGGGPCNLPDAWWLLSGLGVLLGATGMVVGLPVSAIRTYRHFHRLHANDESPESKPT